MTQSLLYHAFKLAFYDMHIGPGAAILAFIVTGILYRFFTTIFEKRNE